MRVRGASPRSAALLLLGGVLAGCALGRHGAGVPSVRIAGAPGGGCLGRRELSLEVTCSVEGEEADPSTLTLLLAYPDGTTVDLKPRFSLFGCDATGTLGPDLLRRGSDYRVVAGYRSRIGLEARAEASFCIASNACDPMEVLAPRGGCTSGTSTEVRALECIPPGADLVRATVNGSPALVEAAQSPQERIVRLPISGLGEGPTTFAIEADFDDGTSDFGSISITVATTPPLLTLDTPPSGTCQKSSTVSFSGRATGPWCGPFQVTLSSTAPGGPGPVTVSADATGSWGAPLSDLPDGANTVVVSAADAVGNASASRVSFLVGPSGIPPRFAALSPTSGICTRQTSLDVTGILTNDYCGNMTVLCTLAPGGGTRSPPCTPLGGYACAFSCPLSVTGDGTYSVTAQADNGATLGGAPLTTTGAVVFRVASLPPSVDLVTPADGDASGGALPFLLSRNLSGWGTPWRQVFPFLATLAPSRPDVPLDGFTLYVDSQPAEVARVTYLAPGGGYPTDPPTAVAGTYYLPVPSAGSRTAFFTARVSDVCGNVAYSPPHAVTAEIAQGGIEPGAVPGVPTQGTSTLVLPVNLYWPESYASPCTGGGNGLGAYDLTLSFDPGYFTIGGVSASDAGAPANPVGNGMYTSALISPSAIVSILEGPGSVRMRVQQAASGQPTPVGVLNLMNVDLLYFGGAVAGATTPLTVTVNQVNDTTAGFPACSTATSLFTRMENATVTFGP